MLGVLTSQFDLLSKPVDPFLKFKNEFELANVQLKLVKLYENSKLYSKNYSSFSFLSKRNG